VQVVIDRFEGDIAVCEKPDRTTVNIPRGHLPCGANEGDVLIIEGNDIRIDPARTLKRREAVQNKLRRLRRSS
jgi:hypothetical protein